MATTTTYVLTYGASHGAWCWYKVVPLLESQGHKVIAFDLPGHGTDHTPLAQVSLLSYTRRLCQILDEQPEPVVLVGHSMGGAVISQAAEECPLSIKTLVYLTALLAPNGQSMFDRFDEQAQAAMAHYATLDETQGAMRLKPEAVRELFYHDCEAADVALARMLLTPQALAPLSDRLHLSQRYESVPRMYIECLRDQALPLEMQRSMYTSVPCQRVYALNTSHSPFFSAPGDLSRTLTALA